MPPRAPEFDEFSRRSHSGERILEGRRGDLRYIFTAYIRARGRRAPALDCRGLSRHDDLAEPEGVLREDNVRCRLPGGHQQLARCVADGPETEPEVARRSGDVVATLCIGPDGCDIARTYGPRSRCWSCSGLLHTAMLPAFAPMQIGSTVERSITAFEQDILRERKKRGGLHGLHRCQSSRPCPAKGRRGNVNSLVQEQEICAPQV